MSFNVEKAFSLISQAREAGRLAHAYLITGPEGSGKHDLAARIIRMVNGLPETAGNLEDLRSGTTTVVQPESKSRRITVDTIRRAEHTLQMAAPAGVTKFAVIDDCDRMGAEAENAFLKTLEEPPKASMLLMLTAQPDQLLATILSRCITVPLKGDSGPIAVPESPRRLLDALSEHAVSGAHGVSGALGLMARFNEVLKGEKEAIAARNDAAWKAEVEHYKKTTEGDWLKRREEFYKALSQSEYLEIRSRLIEYLVAWFGDALRQQNAGAHLDLPDYAQATGALASRLSGAELSRKIEAVEKLRSHLNTNVQEILALEVAFVRAFA